MFNFRSDMADQDAAGDRHLEEAAKKLNRGKGKIIKYFG